MKINWEIDKDNIIKKINEKVSYEEIGKEYNVSGSYIKKICKRNGIFLEPRRKTNIKEHFNKGKRKNCCLYCGKEIDADKKYCNLHCYISHKNNEKIKLWLEQQEKFIGEYTYDFIRNYLMSLHNNKCEKCGWGEINEQTGNIPLELHHIDGDCTNNNINNLQILCPNCHSLTKTFGSINKKSKRYKLKKYKHNLSLNKMIKIIDVLSDDEKLQIINMLNDNGSLA